MDKEKRIKAMYILFAPIVVPYPVWSVGKAITDNVKSERIKHLNEIFEEKMATELEALAYLNNASMEAPLDYDWGNIYFKLEKRILRGLGYDTDNMDLFKDIDEELTNYERSMVNHLRSEIFDTQIKVVKERLKELEKESKINKKPHKEMEIGL